MPGTGMTAGSVTVADNETATGTGLAKALYDADVATMGLPAPPVAGSTTAPYSAARPATAEDAASASAGRLTALRETARRCTATAAALVAYLQANAVAVVPADATGDGLQAGTTHPAMEKVIAIR